jgi:hypothetical protein
VRERQPFPARFKWYVDLHSPVANADLDLSDKGKHIRTCNYTSKTISGMTKGEADGFRCKAATPDVATTA